MQIVDCKGIGQDGRSKQTGFNGDIGKVLPEVLRENQKSKKVFIFCR